MTDRFSLRGFYNYLDTNIGPYLSIYPFGLPGIQPGWPVLTSTRTSNGETQVHTYWGTGIEIEFDGKQLPNSPKHKTSLTLAYDVPIAADWGSLELLTIMNYRSKKYVEHGNVEAYAGVRVHTVGSEGELAVTEFLVEGYWLCAECA